MVAELNFKNEKDAEAYYNTVNSGFSEENSQNEYFGSVNRDIESVKLHAKHTGNTVTVTFE